MTETAERHFWTALEESRQKWGFRRAEKYRVAFIAGLQNLAQNHRKLRSPYRAELAEGTDFLVHLVEHRYIAFQEYDENSIIVAGVFHANMDIAARLKELQAMSQEEILTLKREIAKIKNKNLNDK